MNDDDSLRKHHLAWHAWHDGQTGETNECGAAAPRIEVVAATLRQVAEWGLQWPDSGQPAREDLRELAQTVEAMQGDEGSCPMCEEDTCDEGCPLEGVRRADASDGET